LVQVLVDIVTEGLERRHIKDAGLIGESSIEPFPVELVKGG
jgi:hypothetical protein